MAYSIGNTPYIQIGTQKWQRRNLDVSTYRNGDVIPYVADATTWSNLTTGAWCWYNNDPELGKVYGKLYNWYAVNDSRGLAPKGWHISTNTDWTTLINFLSGYYDQFGAYYPGDKLKEAGTEHWLSPNYGATNSSKFTALGGGYRTPNSSFTFIKDTGYWWHMDEYSSYQAWVTELKYNSQLPNTFVYNKTAGFSVRCIKD